MTVLRFPSPTPGGKLIARLKTDRALRNLLREVLKEWRTGAPKV